MKNPCKHRVSHLAYWNSFAGLVPCKVMQGADKDGEVIFRITADRGPYEKGELKRDKWYHVIPREHANLRKGTITTCQQLDDNRWNENNWKEAQEAIKNMRRN